MLKDIDAAHHHVRRLDSALPDMRRDEFAHGALAEVDMEASVSAAHQVEDRCTAMRVSSCGVLTLPGRGA
jgi:hypothetical protein